MYEVFERNPDDPRDPITQDSLKGNMMLMSVANLERQVLEYREKNAKKCVSKAS